MMLPPTVDATMRGPSQLSSGRGLLGVVLRERTYTVAGVALLLAVVIVSVLLLAVVVDMNMTTILRRAIRAVSARGRLAAWDREVQAAAPGWECSPRARHLCCTTYAVPVPVSSARSDRHMPHRSPGSKHPLTNASPPLKRTRTASCAFHSSSASRSSWPPAS